MNYSRVYESEAFDARNMAGTAREEEAALWLSR